MRRLERLASGLLEAGWLSVVVLVPLFIHKGGVQVFDPPKAGLLRAIALLMGFAWAAKLLSAPHAQATSPASPASVASRLLRTPLFLPVSSFVLITCVATLFSVAPVESFWGHMDRGQGTVTLLAQVFIAVALACNLRSQAQLSRLVTALILPSLPVALYAVFQRFHLEPLHVTARETDLSRVTSLLGQPVFLGAYLGMVMPFTVLRLHAASRQEDGWAARTCLYAVLLGLQACAALFSESRGPMLGAATGIGIGFLTLAARHRARRSVLIAAGAAATMVVLVALATSAVLTRPGASAEHQRMAGRISALFDAHGSGGQFRTTTWEVAARVFANRVPLEFADGSHDEHPGLRTLVGYGPEVQYAVSPPFYGPDLPRLFSYFLADRYHNDLWDLLVTTGVLGLAAWLALQTALIYQTLRELGLLETRSRRGAFAASYGGAALVGAVVLSLVYGSPYALLGLQAGCVIGAALFLCGIAVLAPAGDVPSSGPREALLVAVLTAMIAHIVETQFSFTVTATGLLFAVCAALLFACPRIAPEPPAARHEADLTAPLPVRESVVGGALLGLTAASLGFAFLGGSRISPRAGQVLEDGLFVLSDPDGVRFPAVAIIVAVTLAGGALLLGLEAQSERTGDRLPRRLRWILGIGLTGTLAAWLRLSVVLAERGRSAPSEALIVPRNLALRAETTHVFLVICVLLMLVLTLALGVPSAARSLSRRALAIRSALMAGCAVAAATAISSAFLAPMKVRSAVALGDLLMEQNKLLLAETAYSAAKDGSLEGISYLPRLAKAYAKHARTDTTRADAWFTLANQTMLDAVTRNRLSTENAANVAMVRGNWALRTHSNARSQLASTLPSLYDRALRLNPQDPTLWRSWGIMQLTVLRDPAAGLASAMETIAREPNNAEGHALRAECLMALAPKRDDHARSDTFLEAAAAFAQAATLNPNDVDYRVREARAYLAAGQPDRAVTSMREVLARAPAASPARVTANEVLRSAESAIALVSGSSATR